MQIYHYYILVLDTVILLAIMKEKTSKRKTSRQLASLIRKMWRQSDWLFLYIISTFICVFADYRIGLYKSLRFSK